MHQASGTSLSATPDQHYIINPSILPRTTVVQGNFKGESYCSVPETHARSVRVSRAATSVLDPSAITHI
jgi:hypothetical protein